MNHITPLSDLHDEAMNIQAFLEITPSGEVEEMMQRATDLAVYNARSGKMLADAKYHMNEKMKSEIMEMVKTQGRGMGMASTVQNQLCKAMAREEQHIVDFIERINRATVHQIDLIRTLISYEKEQIKLSPMLK